MELQTHEQVRVFRYGARTKPRRTIPPGDPIEAAKARDRVARELHGEFAYLNFPEEFADKAEAQGSQRGDSIESECGKH